MPISRASTARTPLPNVRECYTVALRSKCLHSCHFEENFYALPPLPESPPPPVQPLTLPTPPPVQQQQPPLATASPSGCEKDTDRQGLEVWDIVPDAHLQNTYLSFSDIHSSHQQHLALSIEVSNLKSTLSVNTMAKETEQFRVSENIAVQKPAITDSGGESRPGNAARSASPSRKCSNGNTESSTASILPRTGRFVESTRFRASPPRNDNSNAPVTDHKGPMTRSRTRQMAASCVTASTAPGSAKKSKSTAASNKKKQSKNFQSLERKKSLKRSCPCEEASATTGKNKKIAANENLSSACEEPLPPVEDVGGSKSTEAVSSPSNNAERVRKLVKQNAAAENNSRKSFFGAASAPQQSATNIGNEKVAATTAAKQQRQHGTNFAETSRRTAKQDAADALAQHELTTRMRYEVMPKVLEQVTQPLKELKEFAAELLKRVDSVQEVCVHHIERVDAAHEHNGRKVDELFAFAEGEEQQQQA